jgi:hypothetical protein
MLIRQQDLEAMYFTSYTNNNDLNYIYFWTFLVIFLLYILTIIILTTFNLYINYIY